MDSLDYNSPRQDLSTLNRLANSMPTPEPIHILACSPVDYDGWA
jgi:hypothetical protein